MTDKRRRDVINTNLTNQILDRLNELGAFDGRDKSQATTEIPEAWTRSILHYSMDVGNGFKIDYIFLNKFRRKDTQRKISWKTQIGPQMRIELKAPPGKAGTYKFRCVLFAPNGKDTNVSDDVAIISNSNIFDNANGNELPVCIEYCFQQVMQNKNSNINSALPGLIPYSQLPSPVVSPAPSPKKKPQAPPKVPVPQVPGGPPPPPPLPPYKPPPFPLRLRTKFPKPPIKPTDKWQKQIPVPSFSLDDVNAWLKAHGEAQITAQDYGYDYDYEKQHNTVDFEAKAHYDFPLVQNELKQRNDPQYPPFNDVDEYIEYIENKLKKKYRKEMDKPTLEQQEENTRKAIVEGYKIEKADIRNRNIQKISKETDNLADVFDGIHTALSSDQKLVTIFDDKMHEIVSANSEDKALEKLIEVIETSKLNPHAPKPTFVGSAFKMVKIKKGDEAAPLILMGSDVTQGPDGRIVVKPEAMKRISMEHLLKDGISSKTIKSVYEDKPLKLKGKVKNRKLNDLKKYEKYVSKFT